MKGLRGRSRPSMRIVKEFGDVESANSSFGLWVLGLVLGRMLGVNLHWHQGQLLDETGWHEGVAGTTTVGKVAGVVSVRVLSMLDGGAVNSIQYWGQYRSVMSNGVV